jgi:uncharacterized membrane protein
VNEVERAGGEGSLQPPEAVLQAIHVEVSGPLPQPQVLAQYEDVIPGGAERIVKLAENQVRHRQSMESRGQIFTFLLALVVLAGGIGLVALGNSIEGLVPLVAALAGLGGLFVYREIQWSKNEKRVQED